MAEIVASQDDSEKNPPNPNVELVRIFDTQQESEALIVQGLLGSAGIESEITALDAPQDILPGVGGTVLLVRAEDEAEARRVIAESKSLELDANAEPATPE